MSTSTVQKSYETNADPIVAYCSKYTSKQHALQLQLQESTLKDCEHPGMLGAPEVLTFGENFIKLIGAKKILDIGTFTGASALAWGLAAGDDAEVYTFDITHDNYKKFGIPVISKCSKTFNKIKAFEAPAIESLVKLIQSGSAGTFDFAFIDADKPNYTNYYNKAVTLLRSGGVILVDNSLWDGRVIDPKDASTFAIDACNKEELFYWAVDGSGVAAVNYWANEFKKYGTQNLMIDNSGIVHDTQNDLLEFYLVCELLRVTYVAGCLGHERERGCGYMTCKNLGLRKGVWKNVINMKMFCQYYPGYSTSSSTWSPSTLQV